MVISRGAIMGYALLRCEISPLRSDRRNDGVRGDICVVYGMRFQDLNSVLSNRLLSDKDSIIFSQLFLL